MLKKFFISMLGTMAAIWLSLGILVIGSIITIGILIGKSAAKTDLSMEKILYVKLVGNIDERPASPTFSDLMSIADEQGDDLESILKSIEAAKDDKMIKGIYIDCCGASLGVASRSEIIEAVKSFKESGKWVYAYADNFTQGDYYVATAADEVYLNPVGNLAVQGLSSQTMFFKDLLDKVGVDIQVVRVGSFKSAVEPYMRMDMSEASELQTKTFLNQIWNDMCITIASNRKVKIDAINMWADSMSMVWNPELYVKEKMVNKLCYRSEVEAKIRKLLKIKADEKLPLVTPTEYMSTNIASFAANVEDHIAVLYAVGDIVDTGESGISSEQYVPLIEQLTEDDKVKGMVLRVNSPGGSAFASEQIWKALEDFKAKGKPLYVSMSDYAASGGYYISCGAEKIYADASTLTGSIGIFGVIPNGAGLMEKIGVNVQTVSTNPTADFPTGFKALTNEQYDAMQKYVERGYDVFTSRVSAGRNIPVDSVKAIGGGRVWDGMTAKKIGLVDELGSLATTVKALNKKLGKDYKVVSYPVAETNLWQMLLNESRKQLSVNIEGFGDVNIEQMRNTWERIRDMSPLQARMEMVIIK